MNSSARIVSPDGALVGESRAQLYQDLCCLFDYGVKLIVLNLQNVTFIDSAGLGVLIMLREKAVQAKASLLLCAPSASIRSVLQITGLEKEFEIFSSLNDLPIDLSIRF